MSHYVDILCFVFWRANNLLRYFSIDKRKTLWGHKYYYCGEGSPAVPWRANTGVGRKGKMKLRFVKFLTSRENEIEKKEGARLTLRALPSPARPRPELSLPLRPPFITSTLFLYLHPISLPPPLAHRPSLPAATGRESDVLQLPLP